jgi:hypothetical protein
MDGLPNPLGSWRIEYANAGACYVLHGWTPASGRMVPTESTCCIGCLSKICRLEFGGSMVSIDGHLSYARCVFSFLTKAEFILN